MSEHIIQCWSCGASTTLNEIRTADGYCPECEAEIDLAEYYPRLAEAHDALHQQAEALRAENGRKQQTIDEYVIEHHKEYQRCEKMRTELEAARGLLREALDVLSMTPDDVVPPDHHIYGLLRRQIATPAPEVQAEQGERQEAVAVIAVDGMGFISAEMIKGPKPCVYRQALRAGDKLYTTPQPGPDVRWLAASLYQACGAYDMPDRILDALSAAASGEPFAHMIDGLLPCVPPSDQDVRALVEALELSLSRWASWSKEIATTPEFEGQQLEISKCRAVLAAHRQSKQDSSK